LANSINQEHNLDVIIGKIILNLRKNLLGIIILVGMPSSFVSVGIARLPLFQFLFLFLLLMSFLRLVTLALLV